MQIHQRTTYTYDGKDYSNLDALPLPMHPKERRDMMNVLIGNRRRLVKLLLGLDEVQDLIAQPEGE